MARHLMPRTGDVRARLRKKLHEKSVSLREEARRVAEQRDALQARHTKETIDKIIELNILKAKGDAVLSVLDVLVLQIKVDVDNAKTEEERAGAVLALERLAERRKDLINDADWAWSIHELERLRKG